MMNNTFDYTAFDTIKSDERNLRCYIENHEGNWFISAGAGAGKTTLLTQRIVRQIIDGSAATENFAVITFTNAAAQEMKERIEKELRERLNPQNGTPALFDIEKSRVETALAKLDLMQISTIHSFCYRIVAENAFAAGYSPAVKLIEPDEEEAIMRKFFDEWFEKHQAEIIIAEKTCTLFEQFAGPTSQKKGKYYSIISLRHNLNQENVQLAKNIEELSTNKNKNLEEKVKWKELKEEYNEKKATGKGIKTIITNLKARIKARRKILKKIIRLQNTIFQNNESITQLKQQIVSLNEQLKNQNIIIATGNTSSVASFNLQPFYSRLLAAFKSIAYSRGKISVANENILLNDILDDDNKDTLDKRVKGLFNQRISNIVSQLADNIRKDWREYMKQHPLIITNDEVLYQAKELLKKSSKLREKLQKTFTKIYVDEFQDTDPVQAEFVWLLATEINKNNKLHDDTLFVVGDPKQSIYHFRGAQVEQFNKIKAMMERCETNYKNTAVVSLQWNHRSNEAILEWINTTFVKVYSNNLFNSFEPYKYMECHSKSTNNSQKAVFQLAFDENMTSDEDTAKEDITEKEIDHLIRLIQKIRDNNNTIKFSDILILTRTGAKHTLYVQKLSDSGIPVAVRGKIIPGTNEILRRYAIFIRCLANKDNALEKTALWQLLYDEDITKYFADKTTLDNIQIPNVAKIKELCQKSPRELAAVLLKETNLFAPNKNIENTQHREIRRKLLQAVQICLSKDDRSLQGFATALENYCNTALEKKEEILLSPKEDAVRLMNLHQAKGLQGKIVIIADRRQQLADSFGCFYEDMSNKQYVLPGFIANKKNYYSYEADANIKISEQNAMDREHCNIEYVAATRAEEVLIFFPVLYKQITGALSHTWFHDYDLPKAESIEDIVKHDVFAKIPVTGNSSANLSTQTLDDTARKSANGKQNQPVFFGVTPSSLAEHDINHHAKATADTMAAGAVFGTVMHRAFELLLNSWSSEIGRFAADNDTIIKQAVWENTADIPANDVEDYNSQLSEILGNFRNEKAPEILSGAKNVRTEYPFEFTVSFSDLSAAFSEQDNLKEKIKKLTGSSELTDDTPIWINGKIDLIVEYNNNAIKIFDFKSDKEIKEDVYTYQLELYKFAVSKIFESVKDISTELIWARHLKK